MKSNRSLLTRKPYASALTLAVCAVVMLMACLPVMAQVVTVTVQGRVYDSSGAAISQATVTAVNAATGLNRTTTANAIGDYQVPLLPPGDYTVTAEKTGFQKSAKKIHLDIGAAGSLDFSLSPGQVIAQVEVQDIGELAEPTRTMVSSVIDEQKIENLPVNGRQFIDFALLAPGVTVGDTTSGSTDVIIEPVTKLSFAGQNIHYNFVGHRRCGQYVHRLRNSEDHAFAGGGAGIPRDQQRLQHAIWASGGRASSTSLPRADPIACTDRPMNISATTRWMRRTHWPPGSTSCVRTSLAAPWAGRFRRIRLSFLATTRASATSSHRFITRLC